MSKKTVYLLLIFFIFSLQSGFTIDLTTAGPTGSTLTINNYGAIDDWWVGANPIYRIHWVADGAMFLSINGDPPLEVAAANAVIWNGMDPPAPVGGAFFHPAKYEDFSYDPASPNVWSTVLKYEDPANDVILMGGLGYKLTDPSPHFGEPYVEFMRYIQLTNMGAADITVNPFIYLKSYGDMNFTYYSNNAPFPFTNWFMDYDWIDGTSDDYAVLQHGNWPNYSYAWWFSAYPPTSYRIQLTDNLFNDILAGGFNYNLPISVAPVGLGGSETAFQFGPLTVAPGEALLFYVYPKILRVDVNTLIHIDYDRINISALQIGADQVFIDTDVSIDFSDMNYVNPLSNTYSQIITVELTGGMMDSGIAEDLENISMVRYWEIFSDTRCADFTADITFTYDPATDGIQDEADLLLAYRPDYGQPWEEYPNIVVDMANNTITALGVEEFGHWVFASTGGNAFAPAVGEVQFMTMMTLPACPPWIPNPVDTFDVSAWIPEGGNWTIEPISVIGTPWADLQDAVDGLTGMSIAIPPGFCQGYPQAKVWVELHINQNTTYTSMPPPGNHIWDNNMYFEPMAGFPDNALWINTDFYAYLYDAAGDSVEYGIPANPFSSPLYVTFEPANIDPFVATLPGYNPATGTFFNYQAGTGALSSVGIIPDPSVDWSYNLWHFTPFIGGLNNGDQTQTTIATASIEPGWESAYLTWMTQTEYNSDYFNIYRDGEVVATVPAAGVSPDPIEYDYFDEGLTGGQEYAYELSVVMLDQSEEFYPDTLYVIPTTSAVTSTFVTIAIEGNSMRLNWDEVPDMTAYAIHRSEDPYFTTSPETEIIRVTGTTYVDQDVLLEGVNYFYKVVGTMTD